MKKEQRIAFIATLLTIAILLLFGFFVTNAEAKYNPAKDYYTKYKNYKEKYKELAKDYRKLEKKYDKRGVELESYYMDLIQCQRVIHGDNPWEFMIK